MPVYLFMFVYSVYVGSWMIAQTCVNIHTWKSVHLMKSERWCLQLRNRCWLSLITARLFLQQRCSSQTEAIILERITLEMSLITYILSCTQCPLQLIKYYQHEYFLMQDYWFCSYRTGALNRLTCNRKGFIFILGRISRFSKTIKL